MHEHHSHDHSHAHSHGEDGKNLAVAFWLNFGFTLVEIVGGVLTNSVAILSDAVHDLGDSLSLGLAWYFQRLAAKDANATYTYGFRRLSVLGALINVLVLMIGGVLILFRAIPKFIHPEEVEAGGMVLLAILGIFVNGMAVYRLRKSDSINERVVSLHLIEDVMGWVAVLIGGIVMMIVHAPWIDPVLSILITCYIFYNAIRNLLRILGIFLQKVPRGYQVDQVKENLEQVKGVLEVHDVHLWTMDGTFMVLTVHIQVDSQSTMLELEGIKREIRTLAGEQGIQHSTIEFEIPGADCVHENH